MDFVALTANDGSGSADEADDDETVTVVFKEAGSIGIVFDEGEVDETVRGRTSCRLHGDENLALAVGAGHHRRYQIGDAGEAQPKASKFLSSH
jgi:hypothetical protein